MNIFRSMLAVTTVALVVACGGNQEPAPDQGAAREPAATPEAPAQPVAQGEPAQAETVPEVIDESTGDAAPELVDESAGDVAEDQQAPEEQIVLTEAATPDLPAAQHRYSEGEHYTVLTTAQGTSSSPDVVEIAEVFWYGCPHCYNFEPYVDNWERQLPDGVELVRLPVMWNPTNELHARLFYTAEALGKLDEMHPEIFKEMHRNGKMLATEAEIEAFFARFGVSSDDFAKTFRSFPVETRLKKAKNLTMRYRIQSVPLVVVNGKYVVNGPGIKNFDDMIAVSNELAAREQAQL
jgi:thiol:disulfide interchange protein DsbA